MKQIFLRLLYLFVTLFAWCLNVDVDLLSTPTSEYPVSKHEQAHQYYEHKNHDYSDHTDTATASAFFGHNSPPICSGRE